MGVALMIEAARAIAGMPDPPRRSILFIAVTGEERGLLGSDYFAHNPTVPAQAIVADVNLDMPLLLYPVADVIACGAEHSSLQRVIETAVADEDFALSPDPMPEEVIFIRSDQYSFVRQGVPAASAPDRHSRSCGRFVKPAGEPIEWTARDVRKPLMIQPVKLPDAGACLARLHEIRRRGGAIRTQGLPDETILRFLSRDPALAIAVERGWTEFHALAKSLPQLIALDEPEQTQRAQEGFVNFYASDAVNPYVTLAAQGPWIVTLKGAVIYDCGGYGMLGLGHVPEAVLDSMNRPHVMANIMTPSISQMRFVEQLRKELGHTRGGSPFTHFMCLNSGSEAVTVASRIADIATKQMTDPGGRYEGCEIRGLTMKGSFHGRTDRPARYSHSTQKSYRKYLASFRETEYLLTVQQNDVADLERVFTAAGRDNVFIEAFFMEPVMGEGNPGEAVTPDYYRRARELTEEHGTLLLVDSIQAGLRAHGVLSIVDYPGFRELPPPDMETYSKALNAGQFPLSVLALQGRAAHLYRHGVYGNTMTSNPRAMDVAVTVLQSITPSVRENIRIRGEQLVDGLGRLADELGDAITRVQGTGLLLSCELNPRYKCYGADSTEDYLRRHGLGVIHGGMSSLRYTPWFLMTEDEVDLIVDLTRQALVEGPRAA
jgi:acetylornithine/succinyldiaminopimelate/putrescine aminotransferase